MKRLPERYDHKEAEPRLQKEWEKSAVYAWDESQPRKNTFVIDTPPPTVSGILHMGHIFSYTQADFIARYQRMKGKTVFYPMGFDDNGLPTERLVENIRNKKAKDYPGREDFIQACRKEVKSAEDEFRRLFKSTALSIDWKQEYQTISDEVRKLSQESFLDLLKKGEAYRDFRPTYWDWVDQTAIAQAEIENKEMPGVMNEIEFTLEDGAPLVIATTRPELLGACVAVMYHPEDPNAAKYKDKFAITPLFGVKVPMIADELVERDKGTGLVMCCTFGDDTDKEWWRKHGLPSRPILGLDGKCYVYIREMLNEDNKKNIQIDFKDCGGKDGAIGPSLLYAGNCRDIAKATIVFNQIMEKKPKQANVIMIELLQTEGKLLNQTNITHAVKCAERSGTPIEIIPTYQWFVKVTDKKQALLAKGAECKWYPEFMQIRLNQWIEGLKEDWCISRQRFFGVPFPVWYEYEVQRNKVKFVEPKRITPSLNDLPIDPIVDLPAGYKLKPESGQKWTNPDVKSELIEFIKRGRNCTTPDGREVWLLPDTDVMDTWATSSISPQINARALTPAASEVEKPSPSGRGLGEGTHGKNPPLPQQFLSNARELRRNATEAEQYMWDVLRNKQMLGFKFRRQHPIASYIADFYCDEAKLVIELDGGQHNDSKAQQRDAERTRFLEGKGLTVLRFWNNDVLENMEGVFQVIADALFHFSPHPNPLPEGEGISGSERYSKLFPADLRPQAHEIIRTWAFYTIVKAHLHSDSIPWKNLMISGWCLAADKSKMSKSKGNVVTPVDLIIEKGADVVRYWASTSRLGADTAFSEDLLKIGKKLVNKLWNATSFASIHLEKLDVKPTTAIADVASGKITEALDKWILSRLHKTIRKATEEFERFEYSDARVAIEEFFWKDFCDNYLELVKARAYGEDAASVSAHFTLYHCLDAILRLFAPIIPHITEELYSHIIDSGTSIHMRGNWPDFQHYPHDETAEASGIACVSILEAIRKAKSEKQVSIKFPIKKIVLSSAKFPVKNALIDPIVNDLKSAGNIELAEWSDIFPSGEIYTDDQHFAFAITFDENAGN